MGFLDHIKKSNNYRLDNKIPFTIEGKRVGQIRVDFVDYFLDSGYFGKDGEAITLKSEFNTFKTRSQALDNFAKQAFMV